MRISSRVRTAVAVAGLLTATVSGCSTTVDGVATCPGCGAGTEPEFPTTRPTPVPPSQSESPTPPPSRGEELSPNANGYVYIDSDTYIDGYTDSDVNSDFYINSDAYIDGYTDRDINGYLYIYADAYIN